MKAIHFNRTGAALAALLALHAPAARAAPGLAEAARALVDARLVAGAVFMAGPGDGNPETAAVGYADLATRRPMRPDTVFWIASVSKAVTCTAVMILVDEGKVGLDDPVSKYLPAFGGQMLAVAADGGRVILEKPAGQIRVRDLLTHTSGLASLTPLERHIDHLPLEDNVLSYPMIPLQFPRGQRYSYSNAGMNTAGRIVEIVSGLRFEDFLRKRLFGPLGMQDTTFWPDKDQLARLAKSYRPSADGKALEEAPIDQLTYPLDDRRRGACPAGGLFSTAPDMYRFCRMIYDRGAWAGSRILSPEAVDRMTTTQTGTLMVTPPNDAWGYGFGWLTRRREERRNDPVSLGAFGAGGAYNCGMWINRHRGVMAVWMVQQAGFAEPERNRVRTAFTDAAVARFGN